MATKAEVRQRVGEDLGLVPIGQTLEAQDQIRIDATYAEVYQVAKEKGLAAWASAGPIPDKCVPSFCLLMSAKLLTSYSVPESRFLRISGEAGPDGMLAWMKLGAVAVPEYESHNEVADY